MKRYIKSSYIFKIIYDMHLLAMFKKQKKHKEKTIKNHIKTFHISTPLSKSTSND